MCVRERDDRPELPWVDLVYRAARTLDSGAEKSFECAPADCSTNNYTHIQLRAIATTLPPGSTLVVRPSSTQTSTFA